MDEKDESDSSKIKVFYPTDTSLKLLGELLTNDTSRNIILTLGSKEMYVNKLAETLHLRVSLVIHHLKKLEDLGLLDIIEKPISKRTKDHKFYKLRTDVFLSFTEDKDENKLKRIFKEGIKFASIGIASIITLFLSNYNPNKPLISRGSSDVDTTFDLFKDSIYFEFTYFSIIVTLSVIFGISFLIYKINKKN